MVDTLSPAVNIEEGDGLQETDSFPADRVETVAIDFYFSTPEANVPQCFRAEVDGR